MSNFNIIKLISEPLTLRPPVQLQIEVKQKMHGRSVTFRAKSVEKRPQTKPFFELTTPNEEKSAEMQMCRTIWNILLALGTPIYQSFR